MSTQNNMRTYETTELKQLYYYFQDEGKWQITNSGVLQRLVIVMCGRQKVWDFYKGTNRKRKVLPAWLFDQRKGLWLFIKLFTVTEALAYRQHKGRFCGSWLQISWEDMCAWLGCTRKQLRTFLKMMEDAGLIERNRAWFEKRKSTILKIRFRVFRLKELLKRAAHLKAFADAQKSSSRSVPEKITTKAGGITDTNTPGGKGYPIHRASEDRLLRKQVPSFPISSAKKVISTTGVVEKVLLIKKNANSPVGPLPPPAASEARQGSPNPTPHVPPAPLPIDTVALSPETFRVVQQLKRIYRKSDFTLARLLQLEKDVMRRLPAYRMSEDRVTFFVSEFTSGSRIAYEEWPFRIDNLAAFIQAWPKALKAINRAKFSNVALSAQYSLQRFTTAHWWQEVTEEAALVLKGVGEYIEDGFALVEDFLSWRPKCWELRKVSEPVRWLTFSFFNAPEKYLAKRSWALKSALLANPALYLLLKNKMPLKKWAGLTADECFRLEQQGEQRGWHYARKAALAELYGIPT